MYFLAKNFKTFFLLIHSSEQDVTDDGAEGKVVKQETDKFFTVRFLGSMGVNVDKGK